MRPSLHILPPIVATMFLALAAPAAAQNDDGLLYFPPELRVSFKKTPAECGGVCLKEVISEEHIVPLPVLFFDDPGSARLPERYRTLDGPADADAYFPEAPVWIWEGRYAKYYELPDIIGYRMRQHPQALLSLEGGYSAQPGEDETVAAERAQVVKEYLVNVWKIAPERITLRRPRQACDSSAEPLLQQEGRRVLFLTDDPELFAPLRFERRYRECKYMPMTLYVNPRMAPDQTAEVEVTISLGDSLLNRLTLPGMPEAERYRIMYDAFLDPRMTLAAEGPLTIRATVRMPDGTCRESAAKTLPIFINRKEGMPPERKMEIPFFPYRGDSLTPFHTALIDRYVAENARNGDRILAIGFSDLSESSYGGRRIGKGRVGRDDGDPWRPYGDSMLPLSTGVKEGTANYVLSTFPTEWCYMGSILQTDSPAGLMRGAAVARYLTGRFPGITVTAEGTTFTDPEIPRYPEERCYSRSVTLKLKREGDK